MSYRLNLNRTEFIVFDSIRLLHIKADRLAVQEINVIVFTDAGGISAFGRTKYLDNR